MTPHSKLPSADVASKVSPAVGLEKKRPLAKIRHDLRTPINHIIGFSEILIEEAQGRAPEPFLRDLQKIRGGGDRLLLADDDAPNRELLCRRLEKLGYQVTACGDGRQALELALTGQFELVLLDLLMPGMDGREVLARMKEDTALKDIPVIMISAL